MMSYKISKKVVKTWDDIYKKHIWGKYPPEELIRFIARNFYSTTPRKKIRILEVGGGTGANVWYLAREGFTTASIDGSPTAVARAKSRLQKEKLQADCRVGLLEELPWQDNFFDCVIDVDSLQCNNEIETAKMVAEIFRVLKPGGKHFSITAKNGCWGDGFGIKIDSTSFAKISRGPFAHMGTMRFATKKSLRHLYKKFSHHQFEYSIRTMNDGKNMISHWIFSCEKPN